jgi:hypothetical protein
VTHRYTVGFPSFNITACHSFNPFVAEREYNDHFVVILGFIVGAKSVRSHGNATQNLSKIYNNLVNINNNG